MAGYFSEKNILDIDPTASKSDVQEGLTVTGNGKGDSTRPAQISKQEYARNYCHTFGHKRWDYPCNMCRDCGMTYEEGARPYHPPDCPAPSCNPVF
jgi:hypothetical protein